MELITKLKEQKGAIIVLAIFAAIFASITFVNHYNFRTYGWDLGINQNAIFDYAHFRWNDCMIMQPSFDNVLADHFSLYPILVSPFYWIFGSYTMLIFQWLAILFGGVGIYKFVLDIGKSKNLATIALVHFFCIWGIYSALSFDYHDNVVGTMFVPWFLLYYRRKNLKWSIVFFLLILISKENIALWAFFIGMGLALRHLIEKNYEELKVSLFFSLAACVYFILIIKVIIPSLSSGEGGYLHHSYNALGSNFGEVIVNIIRHPIDAVKLLFINHSGDAMFDGVKAETYIALLLAGGWAVFFFPEFLVMLIPIIAQKMFNDLPIRWGISDHYSIEFAPILVIALYMFIVRFKSHRKTLAIAMAGVCAVSSLKFMEHRTSEYYKKINTQFYSAEHWKRNFDVSSVYSEIEKIPDDAKVSAQSPLAPHLAFRDYIYHYPFKGDADFIALLTAEENKYPFDDVTYQQEIDQLISSGDWEVFSKNQAVLILKKTKK